MQSKRIGYTTRKSLIYKTGVEYGDYAINYIQGCAHGCKYPCYAYRMAKRFGKVSSYEEWLKPVIVSNAVELLEKEMPKYKGKMEKLHLCFTSDPFMYGYDEIEDLTQDILFNIFFDTSARLPLVNVSVLTKGLLPSWLEELGRGIETGISLVSLNEQFRENMEPNTAPYKDRIEALRRLKVFGHCKTWVSIEPYPTPNIIEQDLTKILNAVGFVDKIVFGKLNYNPTCTAYPHRKEFYNQAAEQVKEFCYKKGIECIIKKGTETEA